jgi:hypothetical protein
MARTSSQWLPGTRKGYAAACTCIGTLGIVVLVLIGGRLAVVVGGRLLVCISMGLNAVSGLVANMLAPMGRRANSHLSGKCCHPKPLACCMVAQRTRDILGATAASAGLIRSPNYFTTSFELHNITLASTSHQSVHHLSSRHPSQSSRSASHDPDLQLEQPQPLHYPAMQGSTC